jgi:hypothetical protein
MAEADVACNLAVQTAPCPSEPPCRGLWAANLLTGLCSASHPQILAQG